MASKKKSVPVVLQYYDVPDNVEEGTFKAKCKHCSATISGSTKATSNFLLHIKVTRKLKLNTPYLPLLYLVFLAKA